ncbi:MAG: hypothetical protein HFI38_01405 [Lachnospiraceae bacterium]|jgi:spore germination cell wall hydrolase CwlJ-like protein|nr:hypothetical protein [Lachnospiraceae bacterium]
MKNYMRYIKSFKNVRHRGRKILVLVLCLSFLAGNALYARATEAGEPEGSAALPEQTDVPAGPEDTGGAAEPDPVTEMPSSDPATQAPATTAPTTPAETTRSGLDDVIDEIDRVDDELGDLEDNLDDERENHDSLQQNKSDLEKYLDTLNGQYKGLSSQLSKVEKDIAAQEEAIAKKEAAIAAKEEEIAAKEESIREKEAEIARITDSITRTQEEIVKTQADLDEQYEAMKLRIQFMYENSASAQYLELLLQADNLISFLNQAEYIEAMLEYDEKMRNRYQETKDELDATKASLEADERKLVEERGQLAKEHEALANERETLSRENTELQEQKKELDKLRVKLKKQQTNVANQQAASASELQNYVNQLVSSSDTINSYEEMIAAKKKYYDELLVKKKQLEEEEERRKAEEAANDTSNSITEGDSGIDNSINVNISDEEYTLLAAIIYCEAGGESYEGKLAVGYVIMNRVRSNRFPDSITGVVYQTNQFSPVGSGRLATILAMEADPDVKGKVTESCRQAAAEVLTGTSNVGESLFFRTHKPVPQLVENLEANGVPYYIIGGHVFYHRWVAY